jgi:hypothetical protein
MPLAIQYKDFTEEQRYQIFERVLEKVPYSRIVGSRGDLYRRMEG